MRLLGAAAFCALVATSLPHVVARAAAGSPAASAKVLDLAADIDPTCKACDDFYQFATGGWLKTHPIPPGTHRGARWRELADQNRAVLTSILEDAAKDTSAPAGSDTQKLGSFYRACMNEDAIEKAGTTPIDPLLAGINGISSTAVARHRDREAARGRRQRRPGLRLERRHEGFVKQIASLASAAPGCPTATTISRTASASPPSARRTTRTSRRSS